jgi:hypothetical protein
MVKFFEHEFALSLMILYIPWLSNKLHNILNYHPILETMQLNQGAREMKGILQTAA